MKKTFYITTPIYYVNDIPHIGHAYTTIAADVLARYKIIQGQDVYFLTGTDEHGEKISEAAAKKDKPEQQFVDEVSVRFVQAWEKLNIKPDGFIRTTAPEHIAAVQKLFTELRQKGDIYKGEYEGWYCTPCETYWTQTQLVDKKCPQCGREVKLLKEETFFFKLSAYGDKLLQHIGANPDFIQPESRKNEVINFIKQGLRDLSITRTSFQWGVPVPGEPKHVIYVWFDALINYISALGYGTNGPLMKKYWPADVHIMGKEIVRFHAVIWPAMLMALGLELPKKVFGHGWWTVEGQKMSKSLGNVVDPLALADQFGVDAVRYFLLREVPFGSDGDFSLAHFKQRFNTDLANDIGNLFSRSLNMFEKYLNSKYPEGVYGFSITDTDVPILNANKEIENLLETLPDKFDNAINNLSFSYALELLWEIISKTNKFIEISAPWALIKNDKRIIFNNVLVTLHKVMSACQKYIAPFMPETAEKMQKQLKLLKKGDPLFPRLEL